MTIKHVSHTVAGADPAGFALALAVAYELHAPVAERAPEVALTARPAAAHRSTGSRTRRRTVRA